MQAVGGNRAAAELSGIRVHRVVIASFEIGGTLAALGGLMTTVNVGRGQSGGGSGFLLSSFAAAFLGSAALRNGEFHVLGTLIEVFVNDRHAFSARAYDLRQGALEVAVSGGAATITDLAVQTTAP